MTFSQPASHKSFMATMKKKDMNKTQVSQNDVSDIKHQGQHHIPTFKKHDVVVMVAMAKEYPGIIYPILIDSTNRIFSTFLFHIFLEGAIVIENG